VLIVAEHDGAALNASTAKCVTCARELAAEAIDVAVLAGDGKAVAEQAACLDGVDRVLLCSAAANEPPLAAVAAPQIVDLAREHTHLLAPSTTFGKDLMPRVAALLGVGQVSDVMAVLGPHRFKRPIYAGNVVVTVAAPPDRPLVATIRAASYAPAKPRAAGAAPIERRASSVALPTHTRLVERRAAGSDRPDLQSAARVVAGGRALADAAGFRLVQELADEIGAAVGASRAAVDAGFAANDLQVGQTGKIIAPALYIAVGISGAIQHLTGIKDAGTIVAINRDADAPIFEVADFALVADLFAAVPELLRELRAARS
jgi:electron transfer flavoprotein alpha subunit